LSFEFVRTLRTLEFVDLYSNKSHLHAELVHHLAIVNRKPQLTYLGHRAAIYSLCQGLEPRTFLSAGGDGIVVRWHLDVPNDGHGLVNVGEPVFSLQLIERRSLLVIGTGSGRLLVVDLTMRREIQSLSAHTKGIFRITLLDDHALACAGGDGTLSIWRITDDLSSPLALSRRIPLCEEKLRDIVLSSDRQRMIVACGDGSLRELDLPLLNERQRFDGHAKGANCAVFHPTKPVMVSGGKDGQVKIWHADGRLTVEWPAHKGSVYATSFDPSGRYLVTAGRDALLKAWDANTLDPVMRSNREKNAHTHSINALLWVGDVLLTASDDRRVQGWRLPD
jgi:WD repeat-containing protein 61